MTSDPCHVAFYRFVRIAEPDGVAAWLRTAAAGLSGQVVVAPEGINGALAGRAPALDAFTQALRHDPALGGLFDDLRLQRSTCRGAPFGRLAVHVRAEILPLGVGPIDPVGRRGRQLAPLAWRALLDDPDVLVIDNRNRFEHRLGRFRRAVAPEVGNFRELPAFIARHAPAWQAEDRQVAMYCTGGIRCEKTAAWMADAFGIEPLQLDGGILRFLAEAPEPERDWLGECFVFDNRIALDARLHPTATTAAEVYAGDPDEAWRLRRAERLAGSAR